MSGRGRSIGSRPNAVVVAASGADLGLVTPAVAIDRWSLEEVHGRPFVVGALLAYLAALATAELAVVYISPVLVFPLHGGLVVVAMLHLGLRARQHRDGTARDPALGPALLALMLGPLIRIISLTLPLGQIEPAYRYVAAGVPMLVGAVAALWLSGMRPADVGLRLTRPGLQVWVALAALPLGLVEYLILRPQPLGALPWEAAGLLPALAVGLSTGFPEELIFRGLLQTAVRPILGAWNWVYVSVVFAVLHIGYQSPVDLVFVLLVGSLYGLVFERTRSIVGVSISHGLANAILFFVAPNLPWLVALRIGPL